MEPAFDNNEGAEGSAWTFPRDFIDLHSADGAKSNSERHRQQSVDLPAVEHDLLAGESPSAVLAHQPVDVTAGREEAHRPILHRANDEKIGDDGEPAFVLALELDRPDQVAIAL